MLPSIFGENLFDDFFDDSFEKNFFGERNPLYGKHAKNLMKTDVKEEKDGRFIRKERYAGACTRSFYVGDVRPEEVSGKYEFGVLKLRIPKKDSPAIEAPNRIAIE